MQIVYYNLRKHKDITLAPISVSKVSLQSTST